MKITCIADLHGLYPKLPGGDLLIIAGDLTANHTFGEYAFEFITWLSTQEYKRKVVIAGNHDTFLGTGAEDVMKPFCDYLCDSGTEFSYHIDGFPEEDEGFLPSGKRTLKIWGSPWTKTFSGMNPQCKAFTVDTDEELAEKWAMIPSDVDILITHSPPAGIFDRVWKKFTDPESRKRMMVWCHAGSDSLHKKVCEINPQIHCYGHIHEDHGQIELGGTTFINASYVNERYQPVNLPIEIEI